MSTPPPPSAAAAPPPTAPIAKSEPAAAPSAPAASPATAAAVHSVLNAAPPAAAAKERDNPIEGFVPLSFVKRNAKLDKEVRATSADAAFAMARATEFFFSDLFADVLTAARMRAGRLDPLITYNDVANAARKDEKNAFLTELLPVIQKSPSGGASKKRHKS